MANRRILSPAAALKGEAGNMPASVVFVIFTTLFLSLMTTSLLSTMGATTKVRDGSAASRTVSAVAAAYLDQAAAGTVPEDGELCSGDLCAQVKAGTSEDGTATVTVTAAAGNAERTRTLPVPQPENLMITGFDSSGQPVWGPRPGTDDQDSERHDDQ
ncbi:hypothetical protein [Arthrobacter sp. IK3]|uniref:hypothetical protein n=1 Tax=Arthrobacter sp. IK3 TaxID=3448169 RepID=UPI003EE32730